MRVAAWNVNSIRARSERLYAWLEKHEPDVLCLQELKVQDKDFPALELQAKGYTSAAFGQKTYNGVAILAREAPQDVRLGMDDGVDDPEARLVSAQVSGVRVICVYVPNGRELESDKYAYKLAWLERLAAYLQRHHSPDEELILCGDFNCAPEPRDVERPGQWDGGVLTHPDVRAAVGKLEAWGLRDTFRIHRQEEGLYSWWDYRRLGFQKNNGLRIDLLLATAPLAARCSDAWIDRAERKGKKPSDHAPVVADFSQRVLL